MFASCKRPSRDSSQRFVTCNIKAIKVGFLLIWVLKVMSEQINSQRRLLQQSSCAYGRAETKPLIRAVTMNAWQREGVIDNKGRHYYIKGS